MTPHRSCCLLVGVQVVVRATAWQALAAVMPLLGSDARRRHVLPALLRQCQLPDRHVEMQRSLAAAYGELGPALLPDCASDGDANACLLLFRSLAARDDVATRAACAAALPAVLRGAGPRRYGSHLHEALLRLAADVEPPVRLAVASSLHAVGRLLGRDRSSQYLREPLGALLRDEDTEVAREVVAHLGETLSLLAAAPQQQQEQQQQQQEQAAPGADADGLARSHSGGKGGSPSSGRGCGEFVEALLRLEALSGRDWRLQLGLLRVVGEGGGAVFAPDTLSDRLAPVAFRHLAEGPAVLRRPAAEAVVEAWRAARRPAARTAIYGRLVREFALGHGCRARASFVDVCVAALRRFSSRFFKSHLLEACLLLAFDPVPCVRLALCAAMPALKQVGGW